jgi:hypothetical protein
MYAPGRSAGGTGCARSSPAVQATLVTRLLACLFTCLLAYLLVCFPANPAYSLHSHPCRYVISRDAPGGGPRPRFVERSCVLSRSFRGTELFTAGSRDGWAGFLVDGELKLKVTLEVLEEAPVLPRHPF